MRQPERPAELGDPGVDVVVAAAYGAADPEGAARPRALAERPSVAAPSLARGGARRAGDHGRRHRDGRLDHPARRGAGRRADRRRSRRSPSAPTTTRARCSSGPLGSRLSSLDARPRGRRVQPTGGRGRPTPRRSALATASSTGRGRRRSSHNRIRALSPHIGARGELHGRPVIVWRSRVVDGELEILEVQPEGRRRMTLEEFERGLR